MAENSLELNELIIKNVRCFADEQRAPIRPITLLIGENSAGKTTFLGCYRVLHYLLLGEGIRESEGNKDRFRDGVFDMGSFKDIVRHVRGSNKDSFELGAGVQFTDQDKTFDLTFSFQEEAAAETSVKSSYLKFSEKEKIELEEEGKKIKIFTEDSINSIIDNRLLSVRFSPFRLRSYSLLEQLFDLYRFYNHYMDPDEIDAPKSFGNKLKKLKPLIDFIEKHFQNIIEEHRRIRFNLGEVVPFEPVRSKPERIYDADTRAGENILSVMALMFRQKPDEWNALKKKMVASSKISNLFSNIAIKGKGSGVNDPFSVYVKIGGASSNLIDVGYGVSQSLPLKAKILLASKRKNTFLLQQPETHLHPKAQAELGDFFVDKQKDKNKDSSFIIETHSDYLVDRIRLCIRDGKISKDDVSLLYFADTGKEGVKIHHIKLDADGDPVDVPEGYRDFFERETDRMLGLDE